MNSRIEDPQPHAIDRSKLEHLSHDQMDEITITVPRPKSIDRSLVVYASTGDAIRVPRARRIDSNQVERLRPKLGVLDKNVASPPTPGAQFFHPFAVTPELEQEAARRIAQYPAEERRSAVLPLLHAVQHKFGFISPGSIDWVAQQLDIEPIKVVEVVTFYPGFRQKAPGKLHVRVCRTLSCAMGGSHELMDKLCEITKIDRSDANSHKDPISVSPCGNYSVEFAECLASCGTAPVCLVNDDFHEDVSADKAAALLDRYQNA